MDAQQTFEFDMATLLQGIKKLKPRAVQNLFRALLLTLSEHPEDAVIDDTGFVMFTATYATLSEHGGKSDRTLRRDCRVTEGLGLVHSPPAANVAAEFHFRLTDVLQSDSVGWFLALLESDKTAKCQSDKMQSVSLTKPFCQTDSQTDKWADTPNPVYRGLGLKAKASLAADFSEWTDVAVDDDLLHDADGVQRLFEAAVRSGTIADSAEDRIGVFRAAVAATTRAGIDFPGNWFRKLVGNGWHLTTRLSKHEKLAGDALLRRADGGGIEEAIPDLTSERAWSLLCEGLSRHSFKYQPSELRNGVAPEILSAGRAVGLGKIEDRNTFTVKSLKAEFSAAFDRQQAVSLEMSR